MGTKKGGLTTALRHAAYSVLTLIPNSSGLNLGHTFSLDAMTEDASLVPITQASPTVLL